MVDLHQEHQPGEESGLPPEGIVCPWIRALQTFWVLGRNGLWTIMARYYFFFIFITLVFIINCILTDVNRFHFYFALILVLLVQWFILEPFEIVIGHREYRGAYEIGFWKE